MKKFLVLYSLFVFLVIGCSSKVDDFKLKEGTPAYQLAKDLSATLPSLDPELNKVMINTKSFHLTTGEVIQGIQDNFGNRALQLKEMDATRLKDVIEKNAVQLAEKKLLLEEAMKAKSSVSLEELDSVLKDQYSRVGGEEKFLERLESEGIDIALLKKNLEDELIIRHYLENKLMDLTPVSEEEIKEEYQKDKTASVRHILLLTQGKSDQEKTEIHTKMEDLLARARNGEDFAALAKKYSEDYGSKDNGGLYEDFEKGKMVKPFEDAAFSVPVGEISDIIETNYGYHILLVVDRKNETRPLDEVRVELENTLKQKKQAGAFESYFTDLKKKSAFEIIPLGP
jgi:parvulin-like peptidyl-prolyl isomerase